MKKILRTSILLFTASLGLGACGPVIPTYPTWEHDIHPLMVARCIRCHDSPVGHVDPLSKATGVLLLGAPAIPSMNFQHVSDIPDGILLLIKDSKEAVRGTLPHIPRMPPPPAENLEDWEIQMLDNWIASPR